MHAHTHTHTHTHTEREIEHAHTGELCAFARAYTAAQKHAHTLSLTHTETEGRTRRASVPTHRGEGGASVRARITRGHVHMGRKGSRTIDGLRKNEHEREHIEQSGRGRVSAKRARSNVHARAHTHAHAHTGRVSVRAHKRVLTHIESRRKLTRARQTSTNAHSEEEGGHARMRRTRTWKGKRQCVHA